MVLPHRNLAVSKSLVFLSPSTCAPPFSYLQHPAISSSTSTRACRSVLHTILAEDMCPYAEQLILGDGGALPFAPGHVVDKAPALTSAARAIEQPRQRSTTTAPKIPTRVVPIEPPLPAQSTRVVRRPSYYRVPSNNYCPRNCNNCGQSFVPGDCPQKREFCSGECRHSFAFFRNRKKQYNNQRGAAAAGGNTHRA